MPSPHTWLVAEIATGSPDELVIDVVAVAAGRYPGAVTDSLSNIQAAHRTENGHVVDDSSFARNRCGTSQVVQNTEQPTGGEWTRSHSGSGSRIGEGRFA
jgi:hypothetical protein